MYDGNCYANLIEQITSATVQAQAICSKTDTRFDAYEFVQFLLSVVEVHKEQHSGNA